MAEHSKVLRYSIFVVIAIVAVVLAVMMGSSRSLKSEYHWSKSAMATAPSPLTPERVNTLLNQVEDSELGVSIVELGLIYGVQVPKPGSVDITMTLTTPACPYARKIIDDIKDKLLADAAISDVRLHLVFTPAWSWERVPKEVRERIYKRFANLSDNGGQQ